MSMMKIEGLDDIDDEVFKHENEGVDAIKQDPLNNTIYRMETDPTQAAEHNNPAMSANDPIRSSVVMAAPSSHNQE